MPTIGEAVSRLEERLFVGRDAELELFSEWVERDGDEPAILHVHGPGGVGKTWLLRAFRRAAAAVGRPVVYADARTFSPTPEGLRASLAGADRHGGDVVAALNERRPVLMLDTFEDLGPCARYLQEELLTALDAEVKVVFASRFPLGPTWQPWAPFVEHIALGGLSPQESNDYLAGRGITEPQLVGSIVEASGGHPLALSVAADLTSQFEVREFRSEPQWHLTLRNLVEDFLVEAGDAELRELLEASAIVRQFDETTLAAITGRSNISESFGRLCQLSVLRPGEHGLMLHDEVRPILADDLRWRRPDRHEKFRANAAAYYRERMRTARPEDAAWLVAEQIYFSEHTLLRALYFPETEPGVVWIEEPTKQHLPEIIEHHRRGDWLDHPGSLPPPEERCEGVVTALFDDPGCRFQVARDRAGRMLAYGFILAVTIPTMMLFPSGGAIFTLVDWCVDAGLIDPLCADSEDRTVQYLSTIQMVSEPDKASAALGRWCWGRMLESDVFLACTASPFYKAALSAMGFEVLANAPPLGEAEGQALQGFLLDKSLVGNAGWIDAVATQTMVPRPPRGRMLEAELQAVLEHWDNDESVGTSALVPVARVHVGEDSGSADAVRNVIRCSLSTIAGGSESDRLASRVIELLYIEGVTADAGMSRLAVSRATLYRLRKRGVELLAKSLRTSGTTVRSL